MLPLEHETQIRVRYAETDQMGFAYYGNYMAWFEVGRCEWLRSLGWSYRDLEVRENDEAVGGDLEKRNLQARLGFTFAFED